MSANIEIEKVIIKVGDKKISLTWEEVLELKKVLDRINLYYPCWVYSPPVITSPTITWTSSGSSGQITGGNTTGIAFPESSTSE